MFGLHANAEIGYLTNTGEKLFLTILQCSGGSSGGGGGGKDEAVKDIIGNFLEKIPKDYSLIDIDIKAKAKGKTPFVVVCL
jgi:dynein heavy chain